MTRLENWILHSSIDENKKPFQYLTGKVYEHPLADCTRRELIDGNVVRTSKIVSFNMNNHIAVTQSGTVYYLGIKNKKM